jgi:putative addiction module component (TIGR02574 family)
MAKETDQTLSEEWQRELKRRIAEIDSGAVKTIPWFEVREHLRSLLREGE